MAQRLVEGTGGDAGLTKPLAALIAERDWADTPIGPPDAWPQSLHTALSICLESRFPILIWWGPELVMLYNDAYAPLIGAKHPASLGQRGADCFPEIWEIIGPMLEGVRARGVSTWSDDQLLELNRRGFPEECYFTFSYSPIRDESGGIGGIFTAVSETTNRVIGERRLRILRDLAAATAEAKKVEDACVRAAAVLEGSVSVAFSLIYLFDGDPSVARLVASSDLPPGAAHAAPRLVALTGEHACPWPLAEIREGAEAVEVDVRRELGEDAAALSRLAVALPVGQAGNEPAGAVVLGTNDKRPIDADYLGFLALVAREISLAVTDARAWEQERRRTEELAELDRAKTVFFTNVSHELRTPLTLILAPLEDMLVAAAGDRANEVHEQLELIRRNALRLLRLVNALLDFARAESSRIDALFQPTDLAAVTADLAGAFRPAIDAAGLALEIDCPPLAEPVYVDREAWEKIVLNLLSNALKFTFSGGIAVSLRPDGDFVELRVRDTGAGIAESELPHLFERFHQVRDVPSRSHEGSGIGLALVRELTELHGGTIAVESRVGEGSTFVVRLLPGPEHLPADHLGGPEGTAARSLGATPYLEEALRWLPEDARRPGDLPAETVGLRDDLVREGGIARNAGARILIADDNTDMRAYLARLLRRYWDVETVADGAEALAAARREPPDLVLSDVMMPNLDGFQLLTALRDDPATRAIPVVLVSARAGAGSAVEGLEAGADDYLVKPFSARELVARVRSNLELARLRVSLAQLEAIFEERARAEDVLAALPIGVATVDGDHAVDLWNAAAERITGIAPQHAVGRPIDEVLPGFAALARALELRAGRQTTQPVDAEGHEVWLAAISARHADGTLYAFQDVTETVALERLRRDLVTTVSHELRTPVSSIYGAVATLARADLDLAADVRHELLEALESQMERLSRIVDELVTVASLDAEPRSVAREELDVTALVEGLVERLRPRAADRSLTVRRPAAPVIAAIDAEKVEQVLEALIDNAVRYGGLGDAIEVALDEQPSRIRFSVRDTGPGIPVEHQPHIGERFYRVDPDLTQGVRGLGLGLYISRQLVALMDGRLWFESTPGEGTTFFVELPRL